jgi:hypothetical protein
MSDKPAISLPPSRFIQYSAPKKLDIQEDITVTSSDGHGPRFHHPPSIPPALAQVAVKDFRGGIICRDGADSRLTNDSKNTFVRRSLIVCVISVSTKLLKVWDRADKGYNFQVVIVHRRTGPPDNRVRGDSSNRATSEPHAGTTATTTTMNTLDGWIDFADRPVGHRPPPWRSCVRPSGDMTWHCAGCLDAPVCCTTATG